MDEAFQASSVLMLVDYGAVIDRRVDAYFSVFQSFQFGLLDVCFQKKSCHIFCSMVCDENLTLLTFFSSLGGGKGGIELSGVSAR